MTTAAPRCDGDDLVLAQLDAVADGRRLGRRPAQRTGDGHEPVALPVPDGESAAVLCDYTGHAGERNGPQDRVLALAKAKIDAGGESMGTGTFNQPQGEGYGGAQVQSTSGKAGVSLAFGIIAMLTWVIWGALLFGPLAIVFGAMARKEVRTDPSKTGDGLALAGMILGAAGLVFWAVFLTIGLAAG
jgi:hypothetical protein